MNEEKMSEWTIKTFTIKLKAYTKEEVIEYLLNCDLTNIIQEDEE